MRKVKFKKWIPQETTKNDFGSNIVTPNTGCFETEFSQNGIFHQWGLAMEDTVETVASYSIALIEKEDGSISEVIPSHFKFIDND
jgi:hypothetical protein